MPQKPSQARTWGTRFDTLPTSPPVSPPAHETIAFDESSPLTTDLAPHKKNEEKMPHDASVFVGSLPSTVDQTELTRLLSDHLSEHTEVKNIKVVRDSKGGVCAFVQCEDAVSAASLIHTLHSSPPKYFLGRILRYEPARAFRTLLISYRTPVQYISTNDAKAPSHSETHNGQYAQTVELELPYAMRLWKPKNSKFISLLYNAEAVDAEDHSRGQPFTSGNASLFLQPVVFDGETVRSLAAYFGRLERFSPYLIDEVIDVLEKNIESRKTYPVPHDAPRSSSMDTRCWEIKWDYRDDCVSALMTLRRVPHLTVTWAHQPTPLGIDRRSPHPCNQAPHHNVAYPLHVQDRLHPGRSPVTPSIDSACLVGSETTDVNSIVGEITDPSNAIAFDKGAGSSHEPPLSSKTIPPFEVNNEPSPTRIEWSEMDFPPLGEMRGGRQPEYGAWGEKQPYNSDVKGTPPLSFSHLTLSGPGFDSFGTTDGTPETVTESREEQELDIPLTPPLGKSPITPKTPGSQFPITPTGNILHSLPLNKEYGYYNDSGPTERDLDPTTLFVGGLETFGPGAWNEEKVANFFSRYGGLESVKVVRPLNSHAAFAFVKFDNVESPARAVLEEHNRIYEGRTMRVQLRDCNPPRGPWRQSRARGRFHTPHLTRPQRCLPESFEGTDDRTASQGENDCDTTGSIKTEAFALSGDFTDEEISTSKPDANALVNHEHGSGGNQTCDLTPGTTDSSTTAPDVTSQTSHFRDWYDDPISTVVTPPSSSFGSSTSIPLSTPTLPYSTSGGFYAPTPWIHPYTQQMQYPMSYFAYPGYAVSSQQVPFLPQNFASPTGSEASGPGGVPTPTQWPGIYGSYMPYPIQPARTPTIDQSQNLNSRAPLVPTGFIQNEQGTLIAVYQPDALDQYMAGIHGVPTSQASTQAVSTWPQYPQPQPHGYPFPGPLPTVVMPSRPTLPPTAQMGWVPNQGYSPQPPQPTPHTPSVPNSGLGLGHRGSYSDLGRQPGAPLSRRQPNRRDQHGAHNNQGRNNQSRSFAGRNSRGNVNSTTYFSNGDGHLRLPQSNQVSGEWGQWER